MLNFYCRYITPAIVIALILELWVQSEIKVPRLMQPWWRAQPSKEWGAELGMLSSRKQPWKGRVCQSERLDKVNYKLARRPVIDSEEVPARLKDKRPSQPCQTMLAKSTFYNHQHNHSTNSPLIFTIITFQGQLYKDCELRLTPNQALHVTSY